MKHAIHSITDIGRLRDENQDFLGVKELAGDVSFFVVADGMGGYAGGSIASTLVTNSVLDEITSVPLDAFRENVQLYIRSAILAGNASVNNRAREQLDLKDMGSTVVCAAVLGDVAYIAHVGDSRAYLLRDGMIRQITEDHTVVQDLVRAGYVSPEDAVYHPSSGILTRCLGQLDLTDPTFSEPIHLKEGDRILLCSDGLSGLLEDDEIGEVIFHENPEDVGKILVDMTNEAGGFDNITLVLFCYGDLPSEARSWPVRAGEPLYRESLVDHPLDEPTVPFRFASRDKGKLTDTMAMNVPVIPPRNGSERSAWLWPLLIGLAILSIGLFVWYFVGTGS